MSRQEAHLAHEVQEGAHLLGQPRAEGLVQVEGDAQAHQAVLLVVRAQHDQAHAQQLPRIGLEHLVVGQPAQDRSSAAGQAAL